MAVTNDGGAPNLAKILRQLEYYFSDSNLPSDKFLQAKMKENEEGYVDISVLLTFNRLKNLGATTEAIVASLKTSSLLATDEAGTRLRRVKPLPVKSEFDSRSVFMSGWPANGPEPTIDEVIALFAPCGKVLRIIIRRTKPFNSEGRKNAKKGDAKAEEIAGKDDSPKKQRRFIGSVFVEMESAEAAERVVAEEFEIMVKDEETGEESKRTLQSELFVDYDKKRKMHKDKNRKVRSGDSDAGKQQQGTKRKRDDENGDGSKNNNNENKDSDKPSTENGTAVNRDAAEEHKENGMQASADTTADVTANGDGDGEGDGDVKCEAKKLKTEDAMNGDEAPANEDKKENDSGVGEVEYEKGLVIKMTGLAENTTREDVREVMEVYGKVSWVDLNRGDVEGCVRFSEACEAKRAVEEITRDKVAINGEEPGLVKLLEDEDEKAYWLKIQLKKSERRNGRDGRRNNGGRGGGRYRGGRRGGRGFNRRRGGGLRT